MGRVVLASAWTLSAANGTPTLLRQGHRTNQCGAFSARFWMILNSIFKAATAYNKRVPARQPTSGLPRVTPAARLSGFLLLVQLLNTFNN